MRQADYFAFSRSSVSPNGLCTAGPWDIYFSAFDESERVQTVFDCISASDKQWLIHEEYGFSPSDAPAGSHTIAASSSPPDIQKFVQENLDRIRGRKLCVDATGFVRPHLLVLLWSLKHSGIREFDVLYSDPARYIADEKTEFTSGPVIKVEQVPGYEGIHAGFSTESDLLIIGAGYDYEQISRACESRRTSKKYILTGLPSLQPHMYQESVLRIHRAHEAIGSVSNQQWLYASANQPFAAAQVLHDLLAQEAQACGHAPRNIYLCPVGPKPHVLGFGVFYLRELEGTAASIIYPFAQQYSRLTSEGLLRTWQYHVEL